MRKSRVNHSSPSQTTKVSNIDSNYTPPNLWLFSWIPYETNLSTLGHFRPVSKGSFDILGGQIHYRLFEGDLVGFLMNEIKWIRITHRPKKINIGSNS